MRILHVETDVRKIGYYPHGLTSVCKLLKTISSENVLEELRIVIFTDNPETLLRMDHRWAVLDQKVLRLSSGKPLEFRLHFIRPMINSNDPQNEDPVTVFVDKLPMIRSDPNIILHLTFDPDRPSWCDDT